MIRSRVVRRFIITLFSWSTIVWVLRRICDAAAGRGLGLDAWADVFFTFVLGLGLLFLLLGQLWDTVRFQLRSTRSILKATNQNSAGSEWPWAPMKWWPEQKLLAPSRAQGSSTNEGSGAHRSAVISESARKPGKAYDTNLKIFPILSRCNHKLQWRLLWGFWPAQCFYDLKPFSQECCIECCVSFAADTQAGLSGHVPTSWAHGLILWKDRMKNP